MGHPGICGEWPAAVLYQTMRLREYFLLAAALSTSAFTQAQTTQTLLATPTTVAWGYYDFHAKPVLTVHSGDTVIMQPFSTCGPRARLKSEGVEDKDIPTYVDDVYDKVPKEARGPGGHILTGPVAIAEAQPGDVLEVQILKVTIDAPFACNGFGLHRGFLPMEFPYSRQRLIPLDREKMI